MKLVVNRCYGGFGLSEPAKAAIAERKGAEFETLPYFGFYENRNDPDLVAVVEELGEAANGPCAKLAVVEIPDGICYEIDDYDGIETVEECHRSW